MHIYTYSCEFATWGETARLCFISFLMRIGIYIYVYIYIHTYIHMHIHTYSCEFAT